MVIRKQYLLTTPENSPITPNLQPCLPLVVGGDSICSSDQWEGDRKHWFLWREASSFPRTGFHPIEILCNKHCLSTPETGPVPGECPWCVKLHECLLGAMP